MKRHLPAAAVFLFAATAFAAAETPELTPDQIIATRQAGMAMVGSLAEAMKTGVEQGWDPKPFQETGAGLAKWGKIYPALFPDGTQSGHETKAKPEIWSDRAGFEKAAANFVSASDKLGDAAKSGDKATFAVAFKAVSDTCGGCHRNYKNR